MLNKPVFLPSSEAESYSSLTTGLLYQEEPKSLADLKFQK